MVKIPPSAETNGKNLIACIISDSGMEVLPAKPVPWGHCVLDGDAILLTLANGEIWAMRNNGFLVGPILHKGSASTVSTESRRARCFEMLWR